MHFLVLYFYFFLLLCSHVVVLQHHLENVLKDNHSFSKFGVLRGLHIQPGMGKLVTVISGKIFDVAVDARPDSKTYGKWHAEVLDSTRPHFWIPDGFLHGFYVRILSLTLY